jgi:hypothetical protein
MFFYGTSSISKIKKKQVKNSKKKLYIGNNQVVQVWYKLVQVALL